MSQTQDFLAYLRNRDFDGLGEWLSRILEPTKDDAIRAQTGKMRYDGALLVPLLQTADKEASSALLANPLVRSAMQSKDVEHDGWILDLVQKDPFAWVWALEQGWGELVEPRPSVLKGMTIMRTRDILDAYLSDAEKTGADKLEMEAGKRAWDGWLRPVSKRNPWLIGQLYFPQRMELEHMATCSQQVSFPGHFWKRIHAAYPDAAKLREEAQATYAGLGLSYGSSEDKTVLAKAIGLVPVVADSISMEFEPGQ